MLDFQIEGDAFEDPFESHHFREDGFLVFLVSAVRYAIAKAATEDNEALAMIADLTKGEQRSFTEMVWPVCDRYQSAKIFISHVISGKRCDVEVSFPFAVLDIQFTPRNEFDVFFLARFVEGTVGKDVAVVGDGDGLMTDLLQPGNILLWRAKSVEG
jgi:hypothetical protein